MIILKEPELEKAEILTDGGCSYVLTGGPVRLTVNSLGAGIRKLEIKTAENLFQNIALSFYDQRDWAENSLYAGATLAPAAGRVKDGLIRAGGRTMHLSLNENNKTHLHGGFQNLSFALWNLKQASENSVTFSASLPDGADGYPGNRKFTVTYKTADYGLKITEEAVTDRPTYINMSNHTYYNLNGFYPQEEGLSGLNQYLKINADRVCYNDSLHLPSGEGPVSGTEFDFTSPRRIKDMLSQYSGSPHLKNACGYNHTFLLNGDVRTPAYTLLSASRKLALDFYTDAPAVTFYSAGYVGSSLRLCPSGSGSSNLSGRGRSLPFISSYPGCAVALEPSFPPYCFPENGGEPYITDPGTRFRRTLFLSPRYFY